MAIKHSINFKGTRLTRSRKLVTLPNDGTPYLKFGMADFAATDDQGGKLVPTEYTLGSDGRRLYARPIPLNGHSQTNVAYGKNGYVYACINGVLYSGKIKKD